MHPKKEKKNHSKHQLGDGFKDFLFSPLFGEDEPILTSIFFKWVVQPPTRSMFRGEVLVRFHGDGLADDVQLLLDISHIVGLWRIDGSWRLNNLVKL